MVLTMTCSRSQKFLSNHSSFGCAANLLNSDPQTYRRCGQVGLHVHSRMSGFSSLRFEGLNCDGPSWGTMTMSSRPFPLTSAWPTPCEAPAGTSGSKTPSQDVNRPLVGSWCTRFPPPHGRSLLGGTIPPSSLPQPIISSFWLSVLVSQSRLALRCLTPEFQNHHLGLGRNMPQRSRSIGAIKPRRAA